MPNVDANFVMEHGILLHALDIDGIAFDVYQVGSLRFRIEHNEDGDSEITLRGHM